MIDYADYEKLPLSDKWMAHATMDAAPFFRLWKRKFERLIWMALYDPRGQGGTAQWYITAQTRQDEEDMLASDDDFEPGVDEDDDDESDYDDDSEYDDDDDESEEDDESEDVDKQATESSGSEGEEDDISSGEDVHVPSEEVDGLMEDAYGKKEEDDDDDATAECPNPADRHPFQLLDMNSSDLDRKTKVRSFLSLPPSLYTCSRWTHGCSSNMISFEDK